MTTQIEVLSDEAIDAVAGGLSCEDAGTVRQAYSAIGQMFANNGLTALAAVYEAYGAGVSVGACTPKGK